MIEQLLALHNSAMMIDQYSQNIFIYYMYLYFTNEL